MAQVNARNKVTGEVRLIPEHWVTSTAPTIVGRWELTKGTAERLDADVVPTMKSTIGEMTAYAERNGIDLGDAKLKDDIFDVISNHNPEGA